VGNILGVMDKLKDEQGYRDAGGVVCGRLSLVENAAELVIGAFEGAGFSYWKKFVDLHHAATHTADSGGLKMQSHKKYYGDEHWRLTIQNCEFGPNEVTVYLTNKHNNEEVCANPVVALFSAVFAVGHALPKIRDLLMETWMESKDGSTNELIDARLNIIKEGGAFNAAWVQVRGAVDAFMAGDANAIDTLEKINDLGLLDILEGADLD